MQSEPTKAIAAVKAGMDEKTARNGLGPANSPASSRSPIRGERERIPSKRSSSISSAHPENPVLVFVNGEDSVTLLSAGTRRMGHLADTGLRAQEWREKKSENRLPNGAYADNDIESGNQ